MMLIVVCGTSELRLLADGFGEDDALLEQKHVQFLALVTAAVGIGHHERLLE